MFSPLLGTAFKFEPILRCLSICVIHVIVQTRIYQNIKKLPQNKPWVVVAVVVILVVVVVVVVVEVVSRSSGNLEESGQDMAEIQEDVWREDMIEIVDPVLVTDGGGNDADDDLIDNNEV